MNVMNKKISLRGAILLIVLVVVLAVGIWFWLVYYPIRNRYAELEQQQADIQKQTVGADDKLATYKRMAEALEEIKNTHPDEQTYMHEYTTEEDAKIISDLGTILGDDWEWDKSTSTDPSNSSVIRVRVSFHFSISTSLDSETAYEKCKNILGELISTDNRRCQLGDLTLLPDNGDLARAESITVRGVITFYELAPKAE